MNVYKAANELKMYGEKYAWFAGTKVQYNLQDETNRNLSIHRKQELSLIPAAVTKWR